MIFIPPLFFSTFQFILALYLLVKYYIYRFFSPVVEYVIKRRLANIGAPSILDKNNQWGLEFFDKAEAFARIGSSHTMGFGESYMDKIIDCKDLVGLIELIFTGDNYKQLNGFNVTPQKYFNLQTKSRSWEVAKKHYDLGNELYEAMLDPWMQYSCGYWRDATNLKEAQIAKMDLIARKLMLKPGMKILDIGCGYGSFAKYLAEKYNVRVVGVTISEEQVKYAKKHFAHPDVDILLMDYRDVNEVFDRVVSIAMLAHVGHANYSTFFKTARKCLKDDGILLVHCIGICDKDLPNTDPFVLKYIFPNSILPRQNEIVNYFHGHFYLEDWHNFGYDYSKTLKAWESNFREAWPRLQSAYDERFFRMWIFYLSSATAFFINRKLNLWQFVLTKNGMKGGYTSIR